MHVFKMLVLVAAFGAADVGATGRDATQTYIVRLSDAPLLEHARQRAEQGGMRMFGTKAAVRREADSADGIAYLQRLAHARAQVLDLANATLGRNLQPRHVFTHAANGMALQLTEAEAAALAKLPGVAAVRRERRQRLLTDAGPQWIGADQLWNGQNGAPKTKGEGVVIGIVDTGINPTHPAFAAQGPDGYAISNPRGHYYGLCATAEATCNNKLIGIYDFTDEGTRGVDSVGHGSHVAGIAAGDAITDALPGHTVALQRQVSGVAPHANIIMYKACVNKTASNPDGGCAESDLVAALDQATADGVDVINYSIGGDAIDPYALLDSGGNDAASMFQARGAGVVVVVAAGNEGPGAQSLDEPGNVPWVISVANASHNRRFANALGSFSGAASAPPTLNGQGYTAGYGPANIVYAGDYGNALCGVGESEGVAPTGASNPFAANTFHGEIVVCDRGTYARVEKGYNVLHAGAGAFVLANTAADGESVVSDDHFLPAVHLGYDEGVQLKGWLTGSGTHSGRIAGVSATLDNNFGDVLEASSSRGPTGFGVLKPDLTAPGTNILSAARTGVGEALMTGTSMASPHVAGAAALVIAAHPDWSPAQVESALIGTALAGSVRKEDAVTLGTPLDAGAGRVQPTLATRAGLYLPLSAADIHAQDPSQGGKPENLNRTGIESESCPGQCSFTRKVTDMSGGGTWQASVVASDFAHVTINPNQFTLTAGASQVLTIHLDASDAHLPGTWVNARIVLHKSTGGQSASDTALPLTAHIAAGAAPAFREFTLAAPMSSKIFSVGGLAALPQATFSTTTLALSHETNISLGVDPAPNDLYSTFPGTGKDVEWFDREQISDFPGTPPPNLEGRVFIAEVTSADAGLVRLYAGVDSNGDGQPNAVEQACSASASKGATARCIVDLRGTPADAGKVWAMVEIPQGTASTSYSVKLRGAVPMVLLPEGSTLNSSAGQLTVSGPGHVPAGATFSLRATFGSLINPFPAGRYYGAIMIDALPPSGTAGQVGFVPFALTRTSGGDDVADALNLGADGQRNYVIEPGESLRHTFVDIAEPRSVDIYTGQSASSPTAFYLARADFPAFSVAPEIAPAPPASAAVAQWSIGGSKPENLLTTTLSAGRWYIVATNTGATSNGFTLILTPHGSGSMASPAPGAYYNPARSGHGIFMNRAGDQQALFWYTYLEDGTPVWYQAQNTVPAAGDAIWHAPLARINWTGSVVNTATIVGDVILTPVNDSEFMFSWHLDGTAGSEHFARLGADTCVNFNNTQADFTGQWYPPAAPGYGMDVLAIPDVQFDAFYLYDDFGQPHWLAAQTPAFMASTTHDLNQFSGFCPTCAYAPTSHQPVGSLSVTYSSALAGHFATSVNLLPPLSGSWNIDQPIARLTGKTTCSP